MRWLILSLAAIPAFALWAWVVFFGTAHGWWREALAPPGDAPAFLAAARRLIEREGPGSAALRLLTAGRVAGEHYVSAGAPVDADTRYQVASVSKWISAWGVMHLVEQERLDLDAPVAGYLTRWALPASPFDAGAVTVGRLLSHTGGLTDGLGYAGFAPGAPVQPLEDSLSRAADAVAGADGRVRVGVEPGSKWLYSGGGYALLQLVTEEVTSEPFERYMQRAVLGPLGMTGSTYLQNPDASRLAIAYDADGAPAPRYRFSAPAAAGLYSTAADLTRFLQAHLPGPDGQPPGRGVLEPSTLALMRRPAASAMGTEVWGLGHMLYAETNGGGHVIGHDGGNRPAINATVRLDPASGDGIVALASGHRDLASRLGAEWVFWHTGRLDVETFYRSTGQMLLIVAAGWIAIVLMVVLLGWLATRRPKRTH